MYKEIIALIICALAGACYGLDATMMKFSKVDDPLIIAGIRLSSTLIFLVLFLRRIPKIRKNILFVFGIFSAILNCLFFISALQLIPVADALLLFYSSMIWSCAWKWAVKTPVSKLDLTTAIVVFIGDIILLNNAHLSENNLGYILGILSGTSFATFLFITEIIKQKNPNDQWIHFDTFAFALAIIVIAFSISLIMNRSSFPSPVQGYTLSFNGAIYGFAYYLLFKALALAPAHLVNTYLGAFEPVFGILIAHLILKEEIHGYVYLGVLTIITPLILRGIILYHQETKTKVNL